MIAELGPILRSLARRKSVFALVVAELASGFTVISCLMMASAWYLQLGTRGSGHEEADLVQVTVQRTAPASDARTAAAAARAREAEELARMRALPGVVGAARVSATMLDESWGFPTRVALAERPTGDPTRLAAAWTVVGTPETARVMGLHAREGRLPAPGEAAFGQVLITRCLRDRLVPPGQPVVGRGFWSEEAGAGRVVAVVDDVFVRIPFLHDGQCAAFHIGQPTDERLALYLVRAAPGRRAELLPPLRALFGRADASARVLVEPFDSTAGIHARSGRGLVVILAIMGVTVGLLALLGALAVSSFLVAERTRQIGIRRALGATRGDIIRYFLVENALATLFGTALGLMMTSALYFAMRRVFPGAALDPKLLGLTAALLWIDATLAAMIPARRAAEVPPSVASRAASAA